MVMMPPTAVNVGQNKHFMKVALYKQQVLLMSACHSKLKALPWDPYIHYYESTHSKCRRIMSQDAMYSVLVATHV